MDIALWVAQVLLAVLMLAAGVMKLIRSREELAEQMGWVEDFSDGTVKSIGVLETVAALGLVLPGIFGVAEGLVPWAAVGVILIQVGAIVTHARRGNEAGNIAGNVLLIAVAVFVAWGRFGDYPL